MRYHLLIFQGPPLDLKRCKAVKVKSKTPGEINLQAYN